MAFGFKTDENGRIFPTKNGVSFFFTLRVGITCYRNGQFIFTIRDWKSANRQKTLFLTGAWSKMFYVSLQRYVTKQDFSRDSFSHLCAYSPKLNGTNWCLPGKRSLKAVSRTDV
ncbi:hypothetical protein AVEN_82932-1 [Araneus ventricosus]|uniref:Uncharacterized protein n=1 Tax=Araneus ventricosus TaxID=182803 RepID=A0A4Y2CY78_ARAVE|nr:hypothetical protein AVEN_82932-1 [Araneus ventricosus]